MANDGFALLKSEFIFAKNVPLHPEDIPSTGQIAPAALINQREEVGGGGSEEEHGEGSKKTKKRRRKKGKKGGNKSKD